MSLVQFRTTSVGMQPGTELAQMVLKQLIADLAWPGMLAAGLTESGIVSSAFLVAVDWSSIGYFTF